MSEVSLDVDKKPEAAIEELVVLFNNKRYAVEIDRHGDLLKTATCLNILADVCLKNHKDG